MAMSAAHKRKIGYLYGIFCAVNSVAYLPLSLLCVIYYYKELSVDSDDISFLQAVYLKFLDEKHCAGNRGHLYPSQFLIYNIAYCVLDVLWFILSVNFLYHFVKQTRYAYKLFLASLWFVNLILFLDFMLIIQLKLDYSRSCVDPEREIDVKLCQYAIFPVLIIACRGFVLWMLNSFVGFLLL